MRTRARITVYLALITAAAIAACTRVPELEDRLTPDLRNAPYPKLLPLDRTLEPLASPAVANEELEQQLDARAARLQRRAEALRNAEF